MSMSRPLLGIALRTVIGKKGRIGSTTVNETERGTGTETGIEETETETVIGTGTGIGTVGLLKAGFLQDLAAEAGDDFYFLYSLFFSTSIFRFSSFIYLIVHDPRFI